MVTAKCLLECVCDPKVRISDGCPYNRPLMFQAINLLQISCDVWLAYQETDKERRLRYAEEKRARDEAEGSRG